MSDKYKLDIWLPAIESHNKCDISYIPICQFLGRGWKKWWIMRLTASIALYHKSFKRFNEQMYTKNVEII